ncbi:hypothetical protein BGV53_29645 [Burkholderia ubonensis]|nr:hypothetical protein BGV53_29645 [Burkholderia ubonensis]
MEECLSIGPVLLVQKFHLELDIAIAEIDFHRMLTAYAALNALEFDARRDPKIGGRMDHMDTLHPFHA